MKIYLAGMIQTGFVWRGNSQSENVLITERVRREYPYDLESYHYIGDNKLAPEYFREIKKSIFLDSGAFSMFTQGIAIDLPRYAEYIKDNSDWIHIASNLDEIGRDKEADTYKNQKALERMGVKICPVHHARDADKWLQRYLAEGYDYIFLGGMVPESTKYLRGWLDHVWHAYLTRKDGTAKVKVHGFGLTTLELVERYPWYSIDSTSWVLLGRYGAIQIDLPDGRDIKLTMSSDSPMVYQFDRHYDNIAPLNKQFIEEIIRNTPTGEPADSGYPAYYDPEQLRSYYGWRDHWNVNFYRRLCDRLQPTFRKQQIGVFDA